MGQVTRRVLIVDDDDSIREVASVSLELVGGWEVLTAASGAEGVSLATTERPDVILLDFVMPGMDGPEALSRLRQDVATQDIPVILLTGRVSPGSVAEMQRLPVSAVLSKPFDPMTLAGQISAALGWQDPAPSG